MPTKIVGFKFKAVSAGQVHTVALDFNNNAWTFGKNISGQLGLGDNIDRPTPTVIPSRAFGLPNFKFKSIVAGTSHTVGLDFNNDVWVFGNGEFGQLGLGNKRNMLVPTKIPDFKCKLVSAGGYHTIAIDLDDNVWMFGKNEEGQLGLGHHLQTLKPTKIENFKAKYAVGSQLHTIALSDYHLKENNLR
jgi:alpha-tubulin suppressor-like RCC1 family protein